VWNSTRAVVAVTQVSRGTLLDVVRRVGGYYEIILPNPVDGQRTGFVRAVQVTPVESPSPPSQGGAPRPPVVPVSPPPAAPRQSASPPRPSAPPPSSTRPPTSQTRAASHKPVRFGFFAAVNGALAPSSYQLTSTASAFSDFYREAGTTTVSYGQDPVGQLHGFGGYVFGNFGIGGGMAAYHHSDVAQVQATVPHPFFFGQPREASATTPNLSATTLEFQISGLWHRRLAKSLDVLAFGGPSIFQTDRTLVTDVGASETYPYDVVSLQSPTTGSKSATTVGFHVGGELFWGQRIAVGVGGLYSHGTFDLATSTGVTAAADTGGARALVGFRFRM